MAKSKRSSPAMSVLSVLGTKAGEKLIQTVAKKYATRMKEAYGSGTKKKQQSKTKRSDALGAIGDIRIKRWAVIHKMDKKYLAPLRLTKPIILEEYNYFALAASVNRCNHYSVINNSRTEMQDMIYKYYFEEATAPDVDDPARSQPVMYKSHETIYTITNATNAPAELWIYEVGLRDDVNLTPEQLALRGYNQETTGINEVDDVTYTYPYKSLFAVDQVKQKVYCQKLHKIFFSPGDTVQYKSLRVINRMVTFNDMADTAALYPVTFGSFTVFQIQGCIAAENGAEGLSGQVGLNGADIKVTYLKRRVIQQINSKLDPIRRETTALPITFADDKVVNPFTGTHQSVVQD